jgi:hypothetical protein
LIFVGSLEKTLTQLVMYSSLAKLEATGFDSNT